MLENQTELLLTLTAAAEAWRVATVLDDKPGILNAEEDIHNALFPVGLELNSISDNEDGTVYLRLTSLSTGLLATELTVGTLVE